MWISCDAWVIDIYQCKWKCCGLLQNKQNIFLQIFDIEQIRTEGPFQVTKVCRVCWLCEYTLNWNLIKQVNFFPNLYFRKFGKCFLPLNLILSGYYFFYNRWKHLKVFFSNYSNIFFQKPKELLCLDKTVENSVVVVNYLFLAALTYAVICCPLKIVDYAISCRMKIFSERVLILSCINTTRAEKNNFGNELLTTFYVILKNTLPSSSK